jgi:hypothetical protein
VTLDHQLLGVARPALTLIPVPRGHGGPGVYVGATAGVSLPMTVGDTTYTFDIVGAGQFGYRHHGATASARSARSRRRSESAPSRTRVAPRPEGNPIPPPRWTRRRSSSADRRSRLEIGALAYGIEISGDEAAFA